MYLNSKPTYLVVVQFYMVWLLPRGFPCLCVTYDAWPGPCHAITIRTGVDVTFVSIRNDTGRSLGRNIIPAFPFRLRVTDRKFKEMTRLS